MDGSLVNAFIGGVMIGVAATLMLLLNGRIAGNSGIIAQCLTFKGKEFWRMSYLVGLIAGALFFGLFFPGKILLHYNPSLAALIIAGLLVGYGTRMGGGCTSGHGVCGIARLSARSIAATVIFVVTAMITVWIVRQGGGVWW